MTRDTAEFSVPRIIPRSFLNENLDTYDKARTGRRDRWKIFTKNYLRGFRIKN